MPGNTHKMAYFWLLYTRSADREFLMCPQRLPLYTTWHCVQQKVNVKGKANLSDMAGVALFHMAGCFVLFLQSRKIMHAGKRSS